MADEPKQPDSPGWHFSENDLKFAAEFGRWILAAIAVITLWIQQHNQHAEKVQYERERIEQADKAREENNAGLATIAKEVKKPLVYAVEKK